MSIVSTVRRRALALAPLMVLLAAAPALAQSKPTADDWLRIGLERYERGNFVGAIEAFEKGHELEPRPALVFAIAQAHRRRGDCTRARAYFDAFLASNPAPEQAAAARDQRERCVDAEPTEPPPAPAPAPATTAPPPRPRPSLVKDPVVLAAGGSSLVLAATGAALFVSASRAADQAATAPSYARHQELRERAEARQLYGTIALAAGVTAGAVTVWRIWRLRDRPAPTERAISWTPTVEPPVAGHAGAVGLAAVGRF